ncbi:MAG: DoxX family protein [Planctomycetota bacterium]
MKPPRPQTLLRTLGRGCTGLVAFVFIASASVKLSGLPRVVEELHGRLGFPEATIPWLAATQFAGLALFVFPRTAVLGGVLLTGYLGGAVAALVRVGDPPVVPVGVALLIWLALIFREPTLLRLTPWRRRNPV